MMREDEICPDYSPSKEWQKRAIAIELNEDCSRSEFNDELLAESPKSYEESESTKSDKKELELPKSDGLDDTWPKPDKLVKSSVPEEDDDTKKLKVGESIKSDEQTPELPKSEEEDPETFQYR